MLSAKPSHIENRKIKTVGLEARKSEGINQGKN